MVEKKIVYAFRKTIEKTGNRVGYPIVTHVKFIRSFLLRGMSVHRQKKNIIIKPIHYSLNLESKILIHNKSENENNEQIWKVLHVYYVVQDIVTAYNLNCPRTVFIIRYNLYNNTHIIYTIVIYDINYKKKSTAESIKAHAWTVKTRLTRVYTYPL